MLLIQSPLISSDDDSSEDEKAQKPAVVNKPQVNGKAAAKKAQDSSDSDSSEDEKPKTQVKPKLVATLAKKAESSEDRAVVKTMPRHYQKNNPRNLVYLHPKL